MAARELLPVTRQSIQDEDFFKFLIEKELSALALDVTEMQKYRNYYNGNQDLVYGTTEFRAQFETDFKNFRDNWTAIVVDATLDKMKVVGLDIFSDLGEETGQEDGQVDGDESTEVANQIWNILSRNDFDEQQIMLFESMLVDSRSAMIVWPDPILKARVDWNPGSLVRVRYSDEDWREAVFAVKRWETSSGLIRVNVYTADSLYKYYQSSTHVPSGKSGVLDTVPSSGDNSALNVYSVDGETWPLSHDFNEVPVIEFKNKRGSELENVIPQQDAINYLLISSFVNAGFTAFPQRVFFTGAGQPEGGWQNGPGRVWHLPPTIDADGAMHMGSGLEFKGSESKGMQELIQMVLQHIAYTTKTPVRLFFKSDRGGRGDAPSGDALLVDDEPHLDKVQDRETRAGNSLYRVIRLVAKAANISDDLPPGEVVWQDLRTKYRSALLEEASTMVKMGIPVEFVINHIGLAPEEIVTLLKMLEEKKAEEEAKEQEVLAQKEQDQKAQETSKVEQPNETVRNV